MPKKTPGSVGSRSTLTKALCLRCGQKIVAVVGRNEKMKGVVFTLKKKEYKMLHKLLVFLVMVGLLLTACSHTSSAKPQPLEECDVRLVANVYAPWRNPRDGKIWDDHYFLLNVSYTDVKIKKNENQTFAVLDEENLLRFEKQVEEWVRRGSDNLMMFPLLNGVMPVVISQGGNRITNPDSVFPLQCEKEGIWEEEVTISLRGRDPLTLWVSGNYAYFSYNSPAGDSIFTFRLPLEDILDIMQGEGKGDENVSSYAVLQPPEELTSLTTLFEDPAVMKRIVGEAVIEVPDVQGANEIAELVKLLEYYYHGNHIIAVSKEIENGRTVIFYYLER